MIEFKSTEDTKDFKIGESIGQFFKSEYTKKYYLEVSYMNPKRMKCLFYGYETINENTETFEYHYFVISNRDSYGVFYNMLIKGFHPNIHYNDAEIIASLDTNKLCDIYDEIMTWFENQQNKK